MVLAAPRALVSIRIVCAVRGANTQVFLGWSGTASTSTVTPSVTAGKSACGWHDARSQSRHTRDSLTTWWVSPVTDTLKTVTVSHTHTAAIFSAVMLLVLGAKSQKQRESEKWLSFPHFLNDHQLKTHWMMTLWRDIRPYFCNMFIMTQQYDTIQASLQSESAIKENGPLLNSGVQHFKLHIRLLCHMLEGSRWCGGWCWPQANSGERVWGGGLYSSSPCWEGSSCNHDKVSLIPEMVNLNLPPSHSC